MIRSTILTRNYFLFAAVVRLYLLSNFLLYVKLSAISSWCQFVLLAFLVSNHLLTNWTQWSWSKKIGRPKMIVWSGATFILRWSCFKLLAKQVQKKNIFSSSHGRILTLQGLRRKMYKVVVAQPPPPPGLGWNDFGDSFGIYLGSSLQLV